MRPFPLTVQRGGINRLRIKGAARADMLYDLLNAYVTNAGSISPREGTFRNATLSSSSVGLMAQDGILNVFGTTLVSVPTGYAMNLLIHPTDSSQTLVKIWFAKPFMGFPYVVAQFSNGDIFTYWLQSNGTWAAKTVYFTGNIITPDIPNGLAYQAVRDTLPNPTWSAAATISTGQMVEPTEYTGFAYRAVSVVASPGTSAFTGQSEPSWPTNLGGTIQEFGNFNTTSTTAAETQSSSASSASPLGSNITDRYGDSATIAGQTGATTTTAPPTAANTVTVWQPGTIYAPGAVVQPGTNQGAFINAIPNGDFENGNDGNWILSDADVTIINNPSLAYQGNWCLQFALTTDTDTATMNTFGTVQAGQSVTASAYLNPNNTGANMTMWVNIRWYDSSNSFISQVQSAGAQGHGYRKVSVTAVAPANAARVRVQIESSTGTHSINGSYADLVSWSLEEPAAVSNFLYEAVQANPGTSGTTQPTWPTNAGGTVVDNTVTWEAIGTSIITWQAIPLMYSGTSEPSFPTTVGLTVADPSTYTSSDGHSNNTSMSWQCVNRMVTDPKCPNNPAAALGASHAFEGDDDIVGYSAAVDPTDWSSANNAGYLPTGLNNYGDNPVKVLALYRSNLVIMNAGGYQMWQIDPDPQNMALLDAQPVGSIYTRAAQSAANDLMFLAEVGVRNLGTAGATANLQIGNSGQPVDPLVVAQIKAGLYEPIGLYYPGRGQYWCMFGPQAFVLTINGTGIRAWSRYVFPDSITDWTLNGGSLFLRTAGNLVWQLSADALQDDIHNTGVAFTVTSGINSDSPPYLTPDSDTPTTGFSTDLSMGTCVPSNIQGVQVLGLFEAEGFSKTFLVVTLNSVVAQNFFNSVELQLNGGTNVYNTSAATYVANGTTALDGFTLGGANITCWAWEVSASEGFVNFSNGQVTTATLAEASLVGIDFKGVLQWPYLDMGSLGGNKQLIGVDLVGDGDVGIQIAFREDDPTSFSDAATFSTSSSVTTLYNVPIADTVPGTPVPIPVDAPSYSLILTFAANQAWDWQAANFYFLDNRGRGF